MKKFIANSALVLSNFLFLPTVILAQTPNPADILKPNSDVTQNPAWQPVMNIVGSGLFILMALIIIGAAGYLGFSAYQYSAAGDDINKRAQASEGMKSALKGLVIGLGSVFLVSAIVFLLKQAGIY